MEIQDFQRLVEVFHLHGVRAEFAHLHELFFVADQRGKFKILGQFLVEFLALLRVVAMDFAKAEEHGGKGIAACEDEQDCNNYYGRIFSHLFILIMSVSGNDDYNHFHITDFVNQTVLFRNAS